MKSLKITSILLLSLALTPCLFAEDVGKIISAQGRVDIFKNGSQSAISAREDDLIYVGDSVRTKSGSRAQVEFKDKSVLKIAQNSKVIVNDYSLDDKLSRKTATIELARGKARAVIAKMKNAAEFVILTPNARGSVKGSDIVASYSAGSSAIFVNEGKLSVTNLLNADKPLVVKAGNSVIIPAQGLPIGPRPFAPIEKKLHEEDTHVTVPLTKTGKTSVIKGMVAKVSGSVKITAKGDARSRDARISDIVGEGDSIETLANGYIEVRLDNNNAINLKPGTRLTIVRLIINPATGEFENIFEVTIGNVRARIEGLKGNSKFEVKTPTAVCGAKGTIIYVNVTPNATTGFFEGGDGYMTNTLSGNTRDVGAGSSSTSDYTGSISVPMYVSQSDRHSYSEGWDGGSGYEGYSSSDGGVGTDLLGTGAAEGLGSEGYGDNIGDLEDFFSDVPFSEIIQGVENPNLQAMNFSGSFGRVAIGEDSDGFMAYVEDSLSSYVDGYLIFNLPDTGRWLDGTSTSYVQASYNNPNDDKLWTGGIQATASDGGTFMGWMGGRMMDIEGEPRSDSKFFCIYIDPAGNAGTFSSYLKDGVYGAGFFSAEGDISFTARHLSTGMTPQDLFTTDLDEAALKAKGDGVFLDGGSIYCDILGGKSISLVGEKWGIWHIEALGSYNGITENDWKLALGGTSTNGDNGSDCWVGTMHGSADSSGRWSSGAIDGSFTGFSFSRGEYLGDGIYRVKGTVVTDGDILGDYIERSGDYIERRYGYNDIAYGYGGTWEAIGGGEWYEATDLLTEGGGGLGFDLATLNDFVNSSVPITEAYSSILTGPIGESVFSNVTMDARFYENDIAKIWAAHIAGNYSSNPGESWSLTLPGNGEIDSVTLSGDRWDNGVWHAIVSGTVNDNTIAISNGEAAGTYTDGRFDGMAAGTWVNNQN